MARKPPPGATRTGLAARHKIAPVRDIKLSSLRVCLEVAHQESLTAAAQALNMTQSAVSKNVQMVERRLGKPLFRRLSDGVVPLDDARTFLFRVADGVAAIDAALANLAEAEGGGTLRIAAPPIILQHCLIPHIDDLNAGHPGLELAFRVRNTSARRNVDTDAEIFFSGSGEVPPGAEWLGGDRCWIVAHPDLVPPTLPIERIASYPLLQHIKFERAWPSVAERLGLSFAKTRFHQYEQYSLIIDAALQKLGIAIVPRFVVAEAIASRRLRRIDKEIVFPRMGYYYRLVRREKEAPSRTFLRWLREVFRRSEAA